MLRAALVVLVLILVSVAGLWFVAGRSLPTLDGVVSYPELSRGGVVKFDDRSVPYIEAATDLDLYRIQGYVTAQDRLVQMDMLRRRALGELSEVFGAQSLAQDKLMRTVGINRAVQEEIKTLPREVRTQLDCYTQGVNTYISTCADKPPLEFLLLGYRPRLWRPEDTLAIIKYSQYELDESWRLDDLRQNVLDSLGDKAAGKMFERVFAAPPAVSQNIPLDRVGGENISPIRGSNGWLVSGTIADNKGALMAIDRHNAFNLPIDWYLVSMRSPDMHVAGATIPGVPGVVNGRNDKIGFGLAGYKADVQDLYLEQFSPQMPGKYKTPQGWTDATEITEEIPVRFSGSLFSTTNLLHKVVVTRHGPLLTRTGDSGVALAWIGTNALGHPAKSASLLETINAFNRATNWAQFQGALQKYAGSPLTGMFADTTGNIGSQQAGSLPVRSNGARFGKYESCLLTPGWTGFGDWVGTMPFAEMEHNFNPPQGYYVANMPNPKSDVPVNVNYYRAQRVDGVLASFKKAGQKIGLPDMAQLQADQLAPLAPLVKATIADAVSHSDLIDVFQLKALETLNKWDGNLGADSAGAAIYESFIRTVVRRNIEGKLKSATTTEYLDRYPSWSLYVERLLREKSDLSVSGEERSFKNFIVTSFVQSLKDLRLSENADDTAAFKWGDLHRIDFVNVLIDAAPGLKDLSSMLDVKGVRVGGDQDTVATMDSSLKRGSQQFACREGSTLRLLIDMSDSEKFYETLALGQSGNMFSPRRAGEMKAFFSSPNPVPLPIAFSTDAEAKISEHRLLFSDK